MYIQFIKGDKMKRSKKMLMAIAAIGIMLFAPLLVFAQAVSGDNSTATVGNFEFINKLIGFVGSVKGASTIVIALGVIQLLIMLFKTPVGMNLFKKLSTEAKWIVVNSLTLVSGYITAIQLGSSPGQAIAAMLGAPLLQEFLYKIYKMFIEKKPALEIK